MAHYSRGRILLHWLTVLLVVPQIALSGGVVARAAANREAGAIGFDTPAGLHMGFGALILLIAILRLILRQEAGPQPADPRTLALQAVLALGIHRALYAVLLALPVTGALAWGLGSVPMGRAHDALHLALIGLVVVHVTGALYGQFGRRDGTLARMAPALFRTRP
jgi:cytochrome b561